MSEKILIVDDDPEICAMCAEALSDDGYQVVTSTSGDEALDLAQHEEFEVVLSDICMPGMTGLELLQNLKSADPTQMVIMFSAVGEVGAAIEAIKLGAYDSLPKPLILEELRLSVGKAIRQNSLRRENERLRHELHDSSVAMTELPKFIPLLQKMPKDAAREILELGHVETINSNDLILQENTLDQRLYIVIEGELSVWQDKVELFRLGRGECYGEMNILRQGIRSQGLLAELPGQILVLEREAILAYFNRKEERLFKLFIFNILNSVFSKNRKLSNRLIQLERMLKG